MRTPKPWYRASKDAWFVEINGQQVRLAKGRDNEKAAKDAFGIVMHPDASAWTVPFAMPNVQRTFSPGTTRSIWSLRKLTSAVASLGMVNVVFSSEGLIKKSDISIEFCVSPTFFHWKNALTWPDFLSAVLFGHGSGSFVEALVNTGYASSLVAIVRSGG